MPNYLLQTIDYLRQHEAVMLFDNQRTVSADDLAETVAFLDRAYHDEATGYPHQSPAFEPVAAGWAAQTVFGAAQLLLHRTNAPADLPALLPPFDGPVTAPVLLSADLTLRFLPDLLAELTTLDPDDPLIPLLRERLRPFHYSAIGQFADVDNLDMGPLRANACLRRLYADRVVARQHKALALHPALVAEIRAGFGMFAAHFWPELAPLL
jgi:hypothetical protein